MKKADFVLLITIIGVAAIVFVFLFFMRQGEEEPNKFLIVEAQGEIVKKIPLTGESITLKVEGILGYSIVEIEGERVRISESPCPDKICVDFFGWLEKKSDISVCLPNRVIIYLGFPEGD